MQVPRKLTGLVGLGLLALSAAVGCSTNAPPNPIPSTGLGLKHIILLSNNNSSFWFAFQAGVREADKDLDLKKAGLMAYMEINDGRPQGQVKKLHQLVSQMDVAAVGVSALDAANAGLAEEMRALKKKGIPVITVDTDVDREKWRDDRVAFIGTDNLAAGRNLGLCAKGLRPEGGEYVAFAGRTGALNVVDRLKGFTEGAGDKFKSDGVMTDEHDEFKARENVRKAIKNHPDLHTLLGLWAINGPAIGDVVQELDRKKDFTVVVFDADPKTIDLMDKGLIDALVVQNPFDMGYQGVRLLKALVEKDQDTIKKMLPKLGEKNGDIYDTGLKVVVPDKDSPLKADLFDKNTEFLKLSDFHQWLDKYNLGGS